MRVQEIDRNVLFHRQMSNKIDTKYSQASLRTAGG